MAAGEGGGHPDSLPDTTGQCRDPECPRRQAAPQGLFSGFQTETRGASQPHSGVFGKGTEQVTHDVCYGSFLLKKCNIIGSSFVLLEDELLELLLCTAHGHLIQLSGTLRGQQQCVADDESG